KCDRAGGDFRACAERYPREEFRRGGRGGKFRALWPHQLDLYGGCKQDFRICREERSRYGPRQLADRRRRGARSVWRHEGDEYRTERGWAQRAGLLLGDQNRLRRLHRTKARVVDLLRLVLE